MDKNNTDKAENVRTPRTGFPDAILDLFRHVAGLFVCRLELAAIELGEVRANVMRFIVVSLLGMLVVWFALAYWSALVIYLGWSAWGWKILLIMALVATFVAFCLFCYLFSMTWRGLFDMPATMEELNKDKRALSKLNKW